MSTTHHAIGNVSCIAIEGADARRFAQSQFAGDVETLTPGHWQWNAWLTPQGRVRALMQLADTGGKTLLAILRGGDAAGIQADLARFILRMQVRLTMRTFGACAEEARPFGTAEAGPGGTFVLGLGARSLQLVPGTADVDPDAMYAWRLEDIRLGWPTIPPGEPRFLPPALGLERLGAVAFRKGCYPGQEIAARLHYRGGHKYRLCHLEMSGQLEPGEHKAKDGAPVWILDTSPSGAGFEALAVLPLDFPRTFNMLHCTIQVLSIFDPQPGLNA